MHLSSQAHQAAEYIRHQTSDFQPILGIILGSGLAGLVDQISNPACLNYADIPGFFDCSVSGHSGCLYFGHLEGVPVMCMQGRGHYYEGLSNQDLVTPIRTMKLLGVETLLITNAAGSLQASMQPGSLMLVRDHLNFQCNNPLIGTHDPDFGPRFIGMENLYNSDLRTQIKDTANNLNLDLHEGVYVGVLGPMFETPAEIKMFQILGGDAVGMSTIPEAITAHHCGIKVAVISVITNLGAGMTSEILSHEGTLKGAQLSIEKLSALIKHYLKAVGHQ